MMPLRAARLESVEAGHITLGFAGGWTCRISIVADGVGRVLFTPAAGLREARTWAVTPADLPAVGYGGLDRASLFAASKGFVSHVDASLTLSSEKLRVHVTLEPFALTWEQLDGASWLTCCADRASYAYAEAAKSGSIVHWQARDEHDQYFGLGDKTKNVVRAFWR